MIRLRHNGTEKFLDDSSVQNLGDIMRVCSGEDGRVVISAMRVNGCEIPDENLESLDGFGLDGIDEVEIETREASAVAVGSLESCSEYSREIESALMSTAEDLRAGRIEKANELFADIADALGVFLFTIDAAADALGEKADSLRRMDEELQPWLDELIDAQTERDWVRVADYIEFEVAELVVEWGRRIESVRRICADQEV